MMRESGDAERQRDNESGAIAALVCECPNASHRPKPIPSALSYEQAPESAPLPSVSS